MQLPQIRFRIYSELFLEYVYTLRVFGKYIGFEPVLISDEENASEQDIIIAEHGLSDISVSHFFRSHYAYGDYDWKGYFKKELLHYTASGKPDYLSTCFYLLAYIQEYTEYSPDKYDRFPYSSSVQNAFQCVEQNLVAHYFDLLYSTTPKLNAQIKKHQHPTRFFLTHDIDTLYGALRENAKPLLKKGRIDLLLQLILQHYLQTPDFMLLDKIMQMEDAHDVKSTFFWMVSRNKRGNTFINPDYAIGERRVQLLLQNIRSKNFENGLHKSYSNKSYSDELRLLGKFATSYNRNHYLQAELPHTFNALEKHGIQLDTTMGFAEAPGFRNSFGLPVSPYNVKEKRAYAFVEAPLVVMDSTLRYYKKLPADTAEKYVMQFLEKHKLNAVITVLFHNNYFFDYTEPGWSACYKSILSFIADNKLTAVLPAQIISDYRITE